MANDLNDIIVCPQCLWEDLKIVCCSPFQPPPDIDLMISREAFFRVVIAMDGPCPHRKEKEDVQIPKER